MSQNKAPFWPCPWRGAAPAPRPSARSGRSLEVGRRRISPHVSRPRVSKAGAGDASDEASRARRKARRSGPRSALASPGGLFRLPRACALIQERKPREETRQIRASQPRRRFGSRCCSPAPAPASPRRHSGHASHRRTPSLTAVCFDGASTDSIDCRHQSDAQTTEKTKQSEGPFVKAPVWSPGRGSGPELGAAARGRRGRATGLLGGPWLRALIRPRLPPSSSAGSDTGFQKTSVPVKSKTAAPRMF